MWTSDYDFEPFRDIGTDSLKLELLFRDKEQYRTIKKHFLKYKDDYEISLAWCFARNNTIIWDVLIEKLQTWISDGSTNLLRNLEKESKLHHNVKMSMENTSGKFLYKILAENIFD